MKGQWSSLLSTDSVIDALFCSEELGSSSLGVAFSKLELHCEASRSLSLLLAVAIGKLLVNTCLSHEPLALS